MTIQTSFFNWATSGLPYDAAPWERCSPNLVELLDHLLAEWGGYSLGCEGDRPIRDGTAISSHAYGAALDWRYTPVPTGARNVARAIAVDEVLPFVIDQSAELHIDAIHDYAGDRIWRAGRTTNIGDAHTSWWKTQNGAGSGMGEAWATYFHFETHRDGWADATPIAQRLVTTPPASPTPEDLMLAAVAKTTDGSHLAQLSHHGPILKMGDTAQHDITPAEVFGRGDGRAYDIVGRRVVSWSIDSGGTWNAVVASKTTVQARALMGG